MNVDLPRRIVAARGVPLPLYPELRLLFPAPALERRLARFRPDIVHVVDPMVLGAAGIVWLAVDAPQNLTGKFLRDRKVIPW